MMCAIVHQATEIMVYEAASIHSAAIIGLLLLVFFWSTGETNSFEILCSYIHHVARDFKNLSHEHSTEPTDPYLIADQLFAVKATPIRLFRLVLLPDDNQFMSNILLINCILIMTFATLFSGITR